MNNHLSLLNKYAARLIMITFFLPMKVQVFLLGVICLFFLIQSFTSKIHISKQDLFLAIVLGSGFLLCLSSVVFTPPEYRKVLWGITERKVSLLLIPLIFIILKPILLETIIKEQIYFVYACVVACIIGNAAFIYHLGITGRGLQGISHVEYRQYLEKVLDIHPTYLGMYICYAICILLFHKIYASKWDSMFKYIIVYTLLLFLLASLAKSPIIALVIVFVHYIWARRKMIARYKFHFIGLVAIVSFAYFFIPFFSQRINEMTSFSVQKNIAGIHDNSINERKLILNTDIALLHQYWLTGAGPGRLQEVLNTHYFFYSLSNHITTGYFDPHSEYFWQWLAFGIGGIILFGLVLTIHFLQAIRRKNYLYLYLLILLSITFFTESVLARQHGVLLYTVFTSLFLFSKRENGI